MAIDFLHHINLNQNQIKSVVIDNMTTEQRTTLGDSAIAGQVIFNSSTEQFQCWNGKVWVSLGEKLTLSEVRAALSVTDVSGDGSLSYEESTGVFTYTGPSATEVRAHFSQGTGITVVDGEIATTITQYADADVQKYLSGGTGVTLSDAGEFSIGQDVATDANVEFADIASSGSVTIKGNLTVTGDTVSVNSTEVNVTNAFVFEGATADEHETVLSIDEPTADRKIVLPDADGTIALTSDVRTDEQIEDVVGAMVGKDSSQKGIAVSYDDTNGKLDFDVADPTITLTGDVTGSGTITDLGNVSIALDTVKNKAANGIGPAADANNFTFDHALGTVNVVVSLFIKSKQVYADVEIIDSKSIKVSFAKDVEKETVTINVISAAS